MHMNKTPNTDEEEDQALLQQPKITDDEAAKRKKKKMCIALVVVLVIIGVALAITLPIVLSKSSDDNHPIVPPTPDVQEFNPFITDDTKVTRRSYNEEGTIEFNGTEFIRLYQSQKERLSAEDPKELLKDVYYKPVDPELIPNNEFNKWAKNIYYKVDMISPKQVKLEFYDKDIEKHYSVPESIFPRPPTTKEAKLNQVGYYRNNAPFSISFKNIYTNKTLATTADRKLLISEKFSEIGFTLPTKKLFGLGQHNSQFMLKNGTYSLYSRGWQQTQPTDNALGGISGSHVHPFLICQTQDHDFIGMFFVATNAQAFEILHFGNDEPRIALNYITMGGHIEIYFMMGGSANQIISMYQMLVGTPQMPPYYALGIIQGTQKSVTDIKQLIKDSDASLLSLGGYQIDSYYDDGKLFEPNSADLGAVIDTIHSSNRMVILGMSSAYKNDDTLFAKGQANTLQCAVKRSSDKKELVGSLYGNDVNFPDFFNPKTSDFYKAGISNIKTKGTVNLIDGFDLQGLQFKNDINGEKLPAAAPSLDLKSTSFFGLKESAIGDAATYELNVDLDEASFKIIPFIPGYNNSQYFDTMTISPDAQRSGHDTDSFFTEYYLHNANGLKAAQTVKTLLDTELAGRRPVLTTDASWSGAAKSSGATITNLQRSYLDMQRTIPQAMGLSMFGYSSIMIDACGTKGPFDEEMCARWMQMAAFMPLARNYYTKKYYDTEQKKEIDNPASEFAYFKDINHLLTCTTAMQTKLAYSLYVYSQMYDVHRNGGAIVRPLLFEFPTDTNVQNRIQTELESTYMLGDALLVAPQFDGKAGDGYNVYFPAGNWVNINLYKLVVKSNGQEVSLGRSTTSANVYLRPGKLIPFQQNKPLYKTPEDFKSKLKTTLLINRDTKNFAEGSIFIDNGYSPDSVATNKFNLWKIQMRSKNIQFMVNEGDIDYEPDMNTQNQLEEVRILNADDLMSTNFACYFDRTFSAHPLQFNLEADNHVLSLKPLAGGFVKFKDINVIHFGDSTKETNICQNGLGYKIDETTIVEKAQQVTFNLKSFNGDAFYEVLNFAATLENDQGRIKVSIVPSVSKPFVPNDMIHNSDTPPTKMLSQFFTYEKSSTVPFSYSIYAENDPKTVLYQSNPTKLYASKYFTIDGGMFNMYLEQGPFFGLGERAGPFFFDKEANGVHTRFTYDQANPIDDGKPPGKNYYGFQPFYGFVAKNGDILGVLNWNPRATDFILSNNNGIQQHLDTVSIGGAIVKYFVRGKTIEDLVKQHQTIIGKPALTPLWSFGWQQSRFGYVNDKEWSDAVAGYVDFPLDVMWADIDYMQDYMIFTLSDTYENLPAYVKNNHEHNIRFVPIIDVGVSNAGPDLSDKYEALKQANAKDIFLKAGGAPIKGSSWPGEVFWPDYTKPETTQWLHTMLDYLKNTLRLEFDGIWLDMNEATNNCNGYCDESQRPANSVKSSIFYVPGGRDIESNVIALDAVHSDGTTEFDMHNMYSYYQAKATNEWFTKNQLRPYVLSRSNFPGLGQYAHHWLGDNWTSEQYLKLSVEQMYQYSLFGMPFVGSDICGFNSIGLNADQMAPLCTRWHQLGSFYPFMRNHNNYGAPSHEPQVFKNIKLPGSETTYYQLIQTAVGRKYDVIRYYFSEFARISLEGGSFFKSLSFDWSTDPQAYENIANNIMLGSMLKLSIQVSDFTKVNTEYYFPKGRWCSIYPEIGTCFDSAGNGGANSKQTFPSTLLDYQVHMLGGYILPYQYKSNAMNVVELQGKPLSLAILPLSELFYAGQGKCGGMVSAAGSIFYDDGATLKKKLTRFNILYAPVDNGGAQIIVCEPDQPDPLGHEEEKLLEIYILGVREAGVAQSMTAQIFLKGAPAKGVDLAAPTWDATRDLLFISTSVDGKAQSLYDIVMIELTSK